MTNIWQSEEPAYHHTSVFCHLSSAAQPAPNNDILCRTIVLHCYLYTPPSTLHPKRLLDFSLSQIAFDSTASTNCSHWKPWDVEIGCTSGRCLWMFFYFGYLSADKAVASTGYTVFRAQSHVPWRHCWCRISRKNVMIIPAVSVTAVSAHGRLQLVWWHMFLQGVQSSTVCVALRRLMVRRYITVFLRFNKVKQTKI